MSTALRTPEMVGLAEPLMLGRKVASFVPVVLRQDARGGEAAVPRPPNGPGDFLSLAGTDGFIELPPQPDPFPEGFVARLYRW
jgi:molybdopterin biosynthesis enzyme